jgi:hypothetical protein
VAKEIVTDGRFGDRVAAVHDDHAVRNSRVEHRLSVYALGQWGEYRQDGIVVTANTTTTVPTVTFVPENFGTTVFTIGTPDRSSDEFLHGHFANGNDDLEWWGARNYWADFAANIGAVIYNETDGPAGNATNDQGPVGTVGVYAVVCDAVAYERLDPDG